MDLFDKIISREIQAEIIHEDDISIAFLDINPIEKGHFLVVPKTHSTNMMDISDEILSNLIISANNLGKVMIKKLGVSGYKIVVNNGKEAGQEIMHTHIHVIPTKK